MVKGLPGQLLTRNQFDLTDRLTLTNFELTNQTGLTGQRVDTPSHWRVMKAGGGEATVWRRSGGGGLAEETAAKAAEMIANGGEWPALTRGGETSGGSSGFVRARIAVWSVATALSEEKNTMVAFNA